MTIFHQSVAEINEDASHVILAKNNPDAFAWLYRKYHKQIFIYVYRSCGVEEDAADITTDVFFKALQNIGTYENRGLPYSAWLYKIAMNELSVYQRKKKKVLLWEVDVNQVGELYDDLPQQEDSWLRCLTKSMQGLKMEEYHLLQFRFAEDKSFREIGLLLQLSEENAKTRTYRIFKKLKPLIQFCYAKIQGS